MTIPFKKIIFFSLLVLMQSPAKADIFSWFKDPVDEETLKSVELLAEQQIEHDLQPHSQSTERRNFILKAKARKKIEIRDNIKMQFLSKQEAKDQAKIQAQDFCINYVVETAHDETELYLKQLGFRYNDSIKQAIYAKVKREAMATIKNGQRLSPLLQTITNKVETWVDQEVSQLPAYTVEKEKFYKEDDIIEVYPEGKISEVRKKIEAEKTTGQKKIWRRSECVICTEKFSRIGKRINLPCGHGNMCPPCFIRNYYVSGRHKCPEGCQDEIERADFKISYLKKFVDMALLKRLDPDTYNAIFSILQRN